MSQISQFLTNVLCVYLKVLSGFSRLTLVIRPMSLERSNKPFQPEIHTSQLLTPNIREKHAGSDCAKSRQLMSVMQEFFILLTTTSNILENLQLELLRQCVSRGTLEHECQFQANFLPVTPRRFRVIMPNE